MTEDEELKKEKGYIQTYLEASLFIKQANGEFYKGLRKTLGFFRMDFEGEIKVLDRVEKLYRIALAKLQVVSVPSEIHNFHDAVKLHVEQQIKRTSKARRVAQLKNRGVLLEILKAYGDSEKRFCFLFEKEIKEGEKWLKKNRS